jgi:selenide,water dikinase
MHIRRTQQMLLANREAMGPLPLTSLAHGAGCGCKLPPAALLPLVRQLPTVVDPAVLVGSDLADDAAVYRLSDELALIQTIDFFTPIVDDPYDFGRIAAANALSDIYAMGGRPLMALNVVAFPLERLGGDVLREILRGGVDVVMQAGASVVGGHSIDDPEPKYGLSVVGVAHPDRLLTNDGGRAGDVLVLTKPLGAGAASTAHKRSRGDGAVLAAAVDVMVRLNADAAAAALDAQAAAVTDVTGFGLLGHLHNLALASGVAAEVNAENVPVIDGVKELLEDGDVAVSGGARRNAEHAATFTTYAPGVPEWRRRLVCDPMTSGGLLVAVADGHADRIPGPVVGRLLEGEPGTIRVR